MPDGISCAQRSPAASNGRQVAMVAMLDLVFNPFSGNLAQRRIMKLLTMAACLTQPSR
jgi:hypothetical protein